MELKIAFDLSVSKGLIECRKQGDYYDVIKWHSDEKKTCHTIAVFRYNKKEPCWFMESVGTRLWLDDYEEQENVWVVIEEVTKILGNVV